MQLEELKRVWRRMAPSWRYLVAVTSAASAHAGYLDTIGYTDLATRYGGTLADGSGVRVWQVESTPPAPTPLQFAPNPTSLGIYGVSMDLGGVVSAVSGHADLVAGFLFNGPAPGVNAAVGSEANLFIGAHGLRAGMGAVAPAFNGTSTYSGATPRVLNASFVGEADTAFANDVILRRADGMVAEQGMTMVVSVNNAGNSTTPINASLLGEAYNVITVGRSDLLHENGLSTTDGIGRVVLDLVAPWNAVSFATPMVSAAAAVLIDKAQTTGALNNAVDPRVVRSLLMTGAEKLLGWTHSTTQPTDLKQGAGELRMNNAYDLLLAGEVSPGIVTEAAGWDLGAIEAGGASRYAFFHPGGRFTATLNWNRTIASYGADDSVTPNSLNNLDLRLYSSDPTGMVGLLVDSSVSPLDNVEHLYQGSLPAGWYSLEASGPASAAYALSFQGVPEARFSILAGVLFLGWVGRRSGWRPGGGRC